MPLDPRTSHTRPLAWASLWGFAEATLFFLVPDVLLSRLVLSDWRRCRQAMLAATLGALLGGALMYGWARAWPEPALRAVEAVPAVSPAMLATAGTQWQTRGPWALLAGALTGAPYKLYAVQAGRLGYPLGLFLLASAAARLLRFATVCLLAAGLAHGVRKIRARATPGHAGPESASTARLLVQLHALVWAVFYAFYFAWMPN